MGGARDSINRCGVECGEDQRWVGTENAELIVGNTQASNLQDQEGNVMPNTARIGTGFSSGSGPSKRQGRDEPKSSELKSPPIKSSAGSKR
jgi:hypothetical protein